LCTVLLPECLPNNASGQDREVTEESTTNNLIVRTVQLEEKWFPDLESTELLLPAWLPEVNFVKPIQAGQELKPITIRDSNEEAHSNTRTPDQTTADSKP
jgi:hypothetical protein